MARCRCGHVCSSSTSLEAVIKDDVINSLSQSNVPPSDLDVVHVRQTITSAEHTLTEIDAALEALRQEKAKYQELIDVSKGILSPMRHLPAEILGDVFDYVLCEEAATLDVTRGPWLLARVCVRWREIALSHSRLWSTIRIVSHRKLPRHACDILSILLSRTGTAELFITFHADEHSSRAMQVDHIFRLLLMESDRIRSAHLTIPESLVDCLSQRRGRFGALRIVYLKVGSVSHWGPPPCIIAFDGAPVLEHVTLFGGDNVLLPWQAISSFHSTTRLVFKCIQANSNLTALTIESGDNYVVDPFPSIYLPCLHTLCLRAACGPYSIWVSKDVIELSAGLHAPALQKLVLWGLPRDSSLLASLLLILGRCSPSEFELHAIEPNGNYGTPIDIKGVSSFMDCLPRSIQTLTLDLTHLQYSPPFLKAVKFLLGRLLANAEGIVNRLVFNEKLTTLLPSLRKVKVKMTNGTLYGDVLKELPEKEWRDELVDVERSRLKGVWIEESPGVKTPVKGLISKRGEGVEVVLMPVASDRL